MKRNLKTKVSFYSIFFLLVFICPIALTAQEIDASYKTGKSVAKKIPMHIVGEYNDFIYASHTELNGYIISILQFKSTMEFVAVHKPKFMYKDRLVFIDQLYIDKKGIYILGATYDNDEDATLFLKQELSSATMQPTGEPEILVSIAGASNSINFKSFFLDPVYSPNRKITAFTYRVNMPTSKDIYDLGFIAVNEEGEKVNEGIVHVNDYLTKKARIVAPIVGNDGEYAVAFNHEARIEKDGFTLVYFENGSKEGGKSFELKNSEYGLNSIQYKFTSDKHLAVFGMYGNFKTSTLSREVKVETYGHFFQNLNLSAGTTDEMVLKPFEKDIVKKASDNSVNKKVEKEGFDHYGIFEPLGSTILSDGSILFIQQKITYPSGVSVSKDLDIHYSKYGKSIYLTKFDPTGKVIWQDAIAQYQIGTMWNVGARVFFNGDNAYIVTNDNALNSKLVDYTYEAVKQYDNLSNEVVIFQINKNGEISKSVLAKDAQNMPKIMPMFKPYITSKGIILPTYVTKTTYGLGIISLE